MINIYVEEKNQIPLSYVKSQIVNILETKPNSCMLIESKSCACNTKNGIAVHESSIIIDDIDNYVTSHENYILNCKNKNEIITAVFWLVKSNFYTYDYHFIKEYTIKMFKRNLSERFFNVKHKMCNCVEYELTREPIYCLKSNVVSSRKIGLTVKSVI